MKFSALAGGLYLPISSPTRTWLQIFIIGTAVPDKGAWLPGQGRSKVGVGHWIVNVVEQATAATYGRAPARFGGNTIARACNCTVT